MGTKGRPRVSAASPCLRGDGRLLCGVCGRPLPLQQPSIAAPLSNSHSNDADGEVKTQPPGGVWDPLLRAAQVGAVLGMSDRTVRFLASLGTLPGFKVGRAWRFRRSEIIQYLEEHRGENLLGQ
jgi:excisionase family DNA binding protein